MTAPSRWTDRGGMVLAAWALSLTIHAAAGLGALLFLRQIKPAPASDLFTWNVAMVTPRDTAEPARTLEPTAFPQKSPSPTPITPPPLPLPSTAPPSAGGSPLPLSHAQPAAIITPPPAKKSGSSEDLASSPASETDQKNSADALSSGSGPIDQNRKPEPITAPAPAQSRVSAAHEPTSQVLPATPNEMIASTPAEPATSSAPPPLEHSGPARQDFGWLMETILETIEPLKRYPPNARLERAEGKVIVKMVIHDDGQLSDIQIVKSSGYSSLDQAAMDVLRLAGPIALPRPLGKPTLTVRIPMNYAMDRR